MAEVKVTNMIKFYTLLLLSQGPKHGYELIKDLGERLDKHISASHIYPFLESLQKHRFIRCRKQKDKKIYSLTKAGKGFALKMISRFGGLIDIAIRPKLTVCVHCGCKIYEGGHREIIKKRKLAFCCAHCAMTYKRTHC